MKSNICRTIGVLAVLGSALTANAQGRIYSIAAHTARGGTEIEIRGENITRPKVTRAYANHSYILDFGVPYSGSAEKIDLHSGGVNYFNYARHTPTTARLHIKLTDNDRPTLQHIADGWKVTVHAHNPVASSNTAFVPVGYGQDFVMPPLEPASKMITNMAPKPMTLSPMAAALYGTTTVEPTTTAPKTLALTTSVPTLNPSTTWARTDLKTLDAPEPLATIAAKLTAVEPTAIAMVPATVNAATSMVNTVVVATDKADQPISPDGTPVPQKKSNKTSIVAAPHKAAKTDAATYSAPSAPNTFDKRVTLDFANTDVVQVLKALALQAGVNIVTSPEVSGKVTVSLDNVTVKDALDLVTTMAGVRYAKIGSTFIVTSPGRFSDALKQISGKADDTQETRVVSIYSGMGAQIKAAITKAIPAEGSSNYTMILPSENVSAAAAAAPAAGAAGALPPGLPAAAAAAAPAAAGPANGPKAKDTYIVLVGSKSKLDDVEAQVKELDAQLCHSLLIVIPDNVEAVNAVYRTTSNSAKSLLAAVVEPEHATDLKDQPNRTTVGRVLLYATNTGSEGDQSIILHGPKNEVDLLVNLLGQLDAPLSASSSHVQIYNVKYGDPRSLKEELLVQFPALRVTLPSPSAGSPSIFKPNDTRADANSQGLVAAQRPVGSSTPGGTGTQIDPLTGATSSTDTNFNLPLSRLETGALPMRLVLKGTEDMIGAALDYLKLVDVAPKQVAIEMRVMELSKDDAINAGVSWDITTGGAVKTVKLNNSSNAATTQNTGTLNFGGRYLGGSVTAQLDKLATSNNLVARPNMLALDGRQSEIFIGDVIRYVASIISSQNGPTVTTDSISVGVRLSVLPRVGDDGSITMDLRPVVSFLTGFTNVSQSGITLQLPQTSARQSQSTINIKSGETIAIGGLIQEQDRKSVEGLPILMNLPILGNLFKRTNNDKTRTELVIFLTARTTDGPAMSTSKLPMEDVVDKSLLKGKTKHGK